MWRYIRDNSFRKIASHPESPNLSFVSFTNISVNNAVREIFFFGYLVFLKAINRNENTFSIFISYRDKSGGIYEDWGEGMPPIYL